MEKLRRHFLAPTRVVIALIAIFAMALSPVANVKADVFDEQIKALQREMSGLQEQASRLRAEANSLQSTINALNAQQAALQAQIQANELQLQKTQQGIVDTQKRIENQLKLLAGNLRSMYLESKITPLEMVASSKSISDFIDREEYRNKIREGIQKSLATIRTLKTELETQEKQLQTQLADQKTANEELQAQERQKNDLLAQTQGQEAAYQQLSKEKQAQIGALRAAQAASFSRIFSGQVGSLQYRNLVGNGSSCGGGYPSYLCSFPQDSLVDQWDLYNRECVSYAAWAMEARFGKDVPEFNGNGNAGQWPGYLNGRNGIVANSTPAVGSVVVLPTSMIGGVGHVAVVEAVLDGGWLHVSQYNFNSPPDGKYSEMDLKIVSGLIFIHFP